MKGGVLYIRGSGGMTLNSVSEVLKWDDTEKQGGVIAHLTTRKLTELVEVEIEE
ncbi:hypothetical protein Neosp_004452 [[Neocosmospora] mangrovei]